MSYDVQGLRGTYPALAMLLLGGAIALLASAGSCSPWPRRTWVLLLLALIPVVSNTFITPPAKLLSASDRVRITDRIYTMMGGPVTTRPDPILATSGDDLIAPPPGASREVARDQWRQKTKARPPRNVLWITIDSLRADSTGALGGTSTPNLDALGKQGHVFRNAISQAPDTAFSVESFTTGRYPSRTALAYAWKSDNVETIKFPPFGSYLQENGFQTAFHTGLTAQQLDHYTFRRLNRGFDVTKTAEKETDAKKTAASFGEWLAQAPPQPFFAWVHFFDPHAPYEAHPPTTRNDSARERYESEVRYSDEALGTVLRHLEASGRAKDTIVLVHADHSEAFGEQGRYFHATSYYDSQIHIPMVFRVPGLEPGMIDAPSGNVNIFITLCDLLLMDPPEHVQGFSLLPTLLNPSLNWPPAAYAETLILDEDGRWTDERVRVVTDGRYKLFDWRSANLKMLFDRQKDPTEREDLLEARPQDAKRLLGMLAALDHQHNEREKDRAALEDITYAQVENSLLHGDLPLRRAIFERLWSGARPDLLPKLVEHHDRFRPAVAHQILVLLDEILVEDLLDRGSMPALPEFPTPLRHRLLDRYARWPAFSEDPVPPLSEPHSALEERALKLARILRGDDVALNEWRSTVPLSVHEWESALPALLSGGASDLTPLILRVFDRGGAVDRPFLRAFRASLRGSASATADLVTYLWPSPIRRLQPGNFSKVVSLLLPLTKEFPDALLALHTEARPDDQGRIERELKKHHGLNPLVTKSLSRAWAEVRRMEGEENGKESLTRMLAALPPGAATERLQRELRLAEALPLSQETPAVEVRFLWDAPEGPPTLHLKPIRDLPVGPHVRSRIHVTWTSEDGKRLDAGSIPLPRTVLSADQWHGFPILLDAPKPLGRWHLEARIDNGAPQREAQASEQVLLREELMTFTPKDLVELATSSPIRIKATGTSASQEVFEDGHGKLGLPPIASKGQKLEIVLDIRVWPDGDAPFAPEVQIREGRATVRTPPLPRGERTQVRVELPHPGSDLLSVELSWPLQACLVELYGISLAVLP
jgi:arylsulfatase A-like enzyme